MQRKDSAQASLTHQELIKKLDAYLIFKKDFPLFGDGACNGLATIWLQKMSEKNSVAFLLLLQHIIDEDNVENFSDDATVLKLIAQLRFAQSPANFLANTRQFHIHKVLEVPQNWHYYGYFTAEKLQKCLSSYSDIGSGFLIQSVTRNPHAVAVFRDHDGYHYFDANDFEPSGSLSESAITQKIINSLYDMFGLTNPKWMELVIVATRPKPGFKPEVNCFKLFCSIQITLESEQVATLVSKNTSRIV